MKKRLTKILLPFFAMCLSCNMANAQNDAFFYENFDRDARDMDVASMVSRLSQSGLNFGGFNTDENGLNFDGFNTDENGLNFGDFSDDENGLKFGNFEMEAENAPVGSGLLFLSGLAVLRLTTKDKRRK